MDPILKKMTWKDGMNIQIWNAPPELKALISSWKSNGLINPEAKSDFMLAFVQTDAEVEKYFFEMQKLAPEDQQILDFLSKGQFQAIQSTNQQRFRLELFSQL